MMNDEQQFSQILKAVKSALKNNGWTYRDLGARMGIPESTIKKMFIARDWPFSRLQQVCQLLNLELADLLDALRNQKPLEIEFSQKQELLFSQEPQAFELYWHLVYERNSAEQFRQRRKLKKHELFHLLRLLDVNGLIELRSETDIRIPSVRPVRWNSRSKFVRATRHKWAIQTIEDAVTDGSGGSNLVVQYFQLSPGSKDDFLRALAVLEEDFASRTARDMTLADGKLAKMRVVLAVAEGGFFK